MVENESIEKAKKVLDKIDEKEDKKRAKVKEKKVEKAKREKAKKLKEEEKEEKVEAKKIRVLSILEKEYILDHPKMPPQEIFDKLNGSVKIEDIEVIQATISNPKEAIKSLTAGDLLARQQGSIVMTEASSALSEAFQKQQNAKKPKHNDRIHRIKK